MSTVYTPTDLQGMAFSAVTPRAEMTRAQTHRAQTPGAVGTQPKYNSFVSVVSDASVFRFHKRDL